uniref:Fatty acid synthase n=1 Tax=Phallusia mammillata TaxID=59560 RepID=A0A6F9DCR8_9ASCI|nr:fatty acid synthase [Phallusia mammillata]
MEHISIAGLSGRFPESENVEEFWKNLLAGKDLVTEDERRWKPGLWGLPKRNGKLKELDKFDASFFEVHPKQANNMDPQLRILLEVSFEAIVDAGLNPSKLAGSRTGVWIGVSGSEAREVLAADHETTEGYAMTGCCTSMFANRLSYFYDLKGPSMSVDTACSSSLLALQMAFQSIRDGHCDAAIVGGANLVLKPQSSLQFQRLNMLSPDGACKSFDIKGNGYVRSEAIAVVYVTKKSAAPWTYCDVINAKTNTDGRKKEGITFPSGYQQGMLLRETYNECGLDPKDVSYVEAHGTGTKAGDPQELNAIDEVMTPGRTTPLLIGSVKSNMGHSEPASGLCAVVKCAVAMWKKVLPPNLHFEEPNPSISGLIDKLKVVTKPTSLPQNALIGINSFGFGGSNVHVILRCASDSTYYTPKPVLDLPILHLFTARTEQGITDMTSYHQALKFQQSRKPSDISPAFHPYRGYVINDWSSLASHQRTTSDKEVWFICSGMGSQWKGMGIDLLRMPVFSKAIKKCTSALKEYNLNVCNLLLTADDTTYDNPIMAFVSLAATQVGLIDVLKSLGVSPSGIIGHSVGELACSYADGCLTLEQTIKAAYVRGRCIKEAKLPPGAMAAVGLTWAQCLDQCPPGVAPACHNSHDSVTITGHEQAVKDFVSQLQEKKVFAKLVKTGGVAFHSTFMREVYPSFIEELKKIIPEPKPRSSRWISTSVSKNLPEHPRELELAALTCSAEYHANNLCNPVMFHDAVQQIPENVVTVEVSPHGLMQAILKRSLPPSCERVALADRKESDGIITLFKALGKLHTCGVDLDTHTVHCTAMSRDEFVGSHVDWNHEQSWFVPSVDNFLTSMSGGQMLNDVIKIDTSQDSKDAYMCGHVIDGRALLPATAHLVFAWQTLARNLQVAIEDLPIRFNDVSIHRATVLPESGKLELLVQLVPASNEFRISEGGKLAASGKISMLQEEIASCPVAVENGEKFLERNEIYRKLRLAGYQYKGKFQALKQANQSGRFGSITFDGNYVTFLDATLQLSILQARDQTLKLPTRIREVKIRPITSTESSCELPAEVYRILDKTIVSTHVEIAGLHVTSAPKRGQTHQPLLQKQVFVPNVEENLSDGDDQIARYKAATWSFLTHSAHKLNKKLAEVNLGNGINGYHQEPDTNKILNSNPSYHFLRLMKDLVDATEDRAELLRSRLPLLNSDPLVNYCVAVPDVLTSVVDIVSENVGDAIEAAVLAKYVIDIKQDVSHQIRKHFDSVPNLVVEFTQLVPPGCTDESEDASVTWDPASDTPPPPELHKKNLLILNNPFSSGLDQAKKVMENFASCMKSSKGFLLFHQNTRGNPCHVIIDELLKTANATHSSYYPTTEEVNDVLKENNLDIVARKSDRTLGSDLVLCRAGSMSVVTSTDEMIIPMHDNFSWVEKLKKRLSSDTGIVWLKSDYSDSGLIGMFNCLRKEPNGNKVRCIFNTNLDVDQPLPSDIADVMQRDLAINVYSNGQWGTYRHLTITQSEKVDSSRGYVSAMTKGDLASLQWIAQDCVKVNSPSREYRVAFSALNFRDIMLASGKLPSDAIPGNSRKFSTLLGLEFSGYGSDGERIMGMVPAEGLATHVTTDPKFTWKVPESWTMSEAATVPVVYATAYYALLVRGRLRKGNTVLIHSGAGGVGQAAISIALSHACRVFTTVSTQEKREYLMSRFPKLEKSCFANSRDTTFEDHVMKQTHGKGVDVVLNSLSEEKLEASLRCVAKHGRFLEIGKFDLAQNSKLGMSIFLRNISFHGILLDSLFDGDTPDWLETANHVTSGIQSGVVRPLDTTVFQKTEVESAFRFMAQGKHIGKVMIQVESQGCNAVSSVVRTSCDPNLTYIVTGGLGGFGLELCNWLIERGARHLVVTTRSGVKTAYQHQYITGWRSQGVEVTVSRGDVSESEGAAELLNNKVGGIFHLAMVLKDALLQNQTQESFEAVSRPKCNGVDNLDRLSREVCSNLRWFVVFSSVVSGRGNAGQTNYGLANSYMERVCERRKQEGFPALAIQWGAIGDVGVAVETIGSDVIGGTVLQSMASCLNTLDQFLSQTDDVVVSSIVPAPKKQSAKHDDGNSTSLISAIANIIGIQDIGKIDKTSTFSSLGLDSLMAIEIAQKMERDFGIAMGTDDVQQLTFAKLEQMSSCEGKENEATTTPDDVTRYVMDDIMLTSTTPTISPLNQVAYDISTSIIFVHPLAGSSSVYRDIASGLSAPAIGINCSFNAPLTSISDLASFYVTSLPAQKSYRIVGYSFGACVALEMALKIFKNGGDVTLLLIDGSHSYVSERVQAHHNALHDEDVQETTVIASFLHDINPNLDVHKLHNKLASAKNTDDKLEEAETFLRPNYPKIETSELKQVVSSYHQCLRLGLSHVMKTRYPGNITLVKQKQSASRDYGLSDVCDGEIRVIELDADHSGIIHGNHAEKIADVIATMT